MLNFEEGLLERQRPTGTCLQAIPTATLDLSVMIVGEVTRLRWFVASWDTRVETPTQIRIGVLFHPTLLWIMLDATETRCTSRIAATAPQKTVAPTRELEFIVTDKQKFKNNKYF